MREYRLVWSFPAGQRDGPKVKIYWEIFYCLEQKPNGTCSVGLVTQIRHSQAPQILCSEPEYRVSNATSEIEDLKTSVSVLIEQLGKELIVTDWSSS